MTNAQSTSRAPRAGAADLWRVKFDCFWGVTLGWKKGKNGCESSTAAAFILASERDSGLSSSCPSSPSLPPRVILLPRGGGGGAPDSHLQQRLLSAAVDRPTARVARSRTERVANLSNTHRFTLASSAPPHVRNELQDAIILPLLPPRDRLCIRSCICSPHLRSGFSGKWAN